MDKQYDVGQFT